MTGINNTASGTPSSKKQSRFARWRKSLRRWWQALLPSNSYKRLEYTLPVYRRELEALISQQQEGATRHFLKEAEGMLGDAQKALEEEGNPELGWRWFKASSRLQLYALPEKEFLVRAHSILREASDDEKGLPSWRKATIKGLLADEEGGLDESVEAHAVAQAAKILDEHHDNVYQKLTIIQGRLKVLAILTVFALVFWIVVLPPAGRWTTTEGISISLRIFWFTIILSGVIGATISGFTSSITKSGTKARIP
jgi:hypothetical protein